MAAPDWFRVSAWDDSARADFEARLARSRPHNRSQYLRIKAIALREAGLIKPAQDLFQRVIARYPTSLDAASSSEALGDLASTAGDWASAEGHYRRCIQLRPDLNATAGEVHIALAETLNAQGRHEEALKSLEYLPVARLGLNHSICRWNAALAEAALGVGEHDVAVKAAERALSLLLAPDQFARHAGVGRAVLTSATEQRLRAIAAGKGADAGRPRRRLPWRRGS